MDENTRAREAGRRMEVAAAMTPTDDERGKPSLGGELYRSAEDLLRAARVFWEIKNKQPGQGAAVHWLRGSDGCLLVFTRGEYGDKIEHAVRGAIGENQHPTVFLTEPVSDADGAYDPGCGVNKSVLGGVPR